MSNDPFELMKKRGKQTKPKMVSVDSALTIKVESDLSKKISKPTISKPKPGLSELHTKMDKVLGILESETYIDKKSNKIVAESLLNNETLYRDKTRTLARFLQDKLIEKKIDLEVRTGGDMNKQRRSVIKVLKKLKDQNKFDSIF